MPRKVLLAPGLMSSIVKRLKIQNEYFSKYFFPDKTVFKTKYSEFKN